MVVWLCGMAKGAALGANREAWITIIGVPLVVVIGLLDEW